MLLGAKFSDKVLETLISELHPVVSDERLWYLESGKHISLVEMEDVV